MIKYIQTQKSDDCCGCRACEQVCSHQAITFHEDIEGFIYPILNDEKCVDCGLCELVCPLEHPSQVKNNKPIAIYAAQLKDKDKLLKSSSGGVFTAIAEYVILSGGVVFGAAFTDNLVVKHIEVDTIEGLFRLRGSKYLQSEMGTCMTEIKHHLINGRLVYFVGTPCQVAGLKLFLRKTYDNLITSDLVCHGTPSRKIFSTVVKRISEKYNSDVIAYSFRDKKTLGWGCSSSSSSIKQPNGKIRYLSYDSTMKSYFNAFITGNLMRRNCYSCPFATEERTSDVTIADFWGLPKNQFKYFDVIDGVSLVMINSVAGERIWDIVSAQVEYRSETFDHAAKVNGNLRSTSLPGKDRDISYQLAFKDIQGFEKYFLGGSPVIVRTKDCIQRFVHRFKFLYKVYRFIKYQVI